MSLRKHVFKKARNIMVYKTTEEGWNFHFFYRMDTPPDSPFPLREIRESLRPSIAMIGATTERTAWLEAVFRIFDTLIEVGCTANEALDRMARQICGANDDGYVNQLRETAKQLAISALLARECGADPMYILEDRL